MAIQFSTTEEHRAWEFIQRALPDVSREAAEPLLALVGTHVRIGDPMMYGGQAPIYPIDGADTARIAVAVRRLHWKPRGTR